MGKPATNIQVPYQAKNQIENGVLTVTLDIAATGEDLQNKAIAAAEAAMGATDPRHSYTKLVTILTWGIPTNPTEQDPKTTLLKEVVKTPSSVVHTEINPRLWHIRMISRTDPKCVSMHPKVSNSVGTLINNYRTIPYCHPISIPPRN